MLEQKLTNTDGLSELWGNQLLWFDGESYRLTPISSPESDDIRALKKHWLVFLTGDVAEDTVEIERQSFLKGYDLEECLCDLGILEDEDVLHENELTSYAIVDEEGNILEGLLVNAKDVLKDKDVLAVYDYSADNQTKANAVIAGALQQGYPLEAAMIWVMQLGYQAQDRIVEEMTAIADTVESWTI